MLPVEPIFLVEEFDRRREVVAQHAPEGRGVRVRPATQSYAGDGGNLG